MKKPSTEKVIIVHRPQKPSSQEKVSQANVAVECGTEMGAPEEESSMQAPQEQQAKNS